MGISYWYLPIDKFTIISIAISTGMKEEVRREVE